MANTKSAIKRMKQSEVRRQRNRKVKTRVKTAIREFYQTLDENDPVKARQAYTLASKVIDIAASRGVIHKNNAARKKSRLARELIRIAG